MVKNWNEYIGGIISRKRKVCVWKTCWWGIKCLIMISNGVKQENSRAACRCMIVMWWLAMMYFDRDTCAVYVNGSCISRGWDYMDKMFSHVPPWVPSWVAQRTVISYPTSCQLHSTLNHMLRGKSELLPNPTSHRGFLHSFHDSFLGYK